MNFLAKEEKEKWLKICHNEIAEHGYSRPVLLLSLDQVQTNAKNFKKYLPNITPHYAVKSNPDINVLMTLADEGVNFEIASIYELELLKSIGVTGDRILFSNPIKRQNDIKKAYEYGVLWFVTDCEEEMIKIHEVAPKSKIYLRIDVNNGGADYPLSKKFGCKKGNIDRIFYSASNKKINLAGLTFHVGSQNRRIDKWIDAISKCKKLITKMHSYDLNVELLNIGGGFPVQHSKEIPSIQEFGPLLNEAVSNKIFKDIKVVAEPGRYMTGDAAWMITKIILATDKGEINCPDKRVYLDAGIFSGLVEPKEGIFYNWTTDKDGDEDEKATLGGPTCDSLDIIQNLVTLPKTLIEGDYIYVPNCGAYTLAYATGPMGGNGFNGFESPIIKYVD